MTNLLQKYTKYLVLSFQLPSTAAYIFNYSRQLTPGYTITLTLLPPPIARAAPAPRLHQHHLSVKTTSGAVSGTGGTTGPHTDYLGLGTGLPYCFLRRRKSTSSRPLYRCSVSSIVASFSGLVCRKFGRGVCPR